ncbi:Phosphoadenosine phosphosulfate reductase family protein [Oscillibacter sp. PC13]|uniref:phosphoadenosine phosphosulfate reductase domain-containing protein n=1 Tax=Oscillibacter sp. PC13 TaxID=1855299 RepID=UPI0008ED87A6|nr:phosphoadenosine phosphosulfate reductase family protein [Oscillibacter sp. PC13]SFP74979.1 Phosphoadenosine phosphosulfate reductase family protein [Oscillibacter sp. PC13]
MYSYSWDNETGGLLLNSSPLSFSKEPRPVYYKELDILGFDQYWNYEKNDAYPYMWAEANNYFYRGRLVAKTKGGSMCTAPEIVLFEEPEPNGTPLRFVDIPAMVEKNRDLLEKLAAETIKKIYNTYVEYMAKVDVFYVAFSGGKDSIVTLDLVQRSLPHNKFKVLFGDTGMEFPDTYRIVDTIERECNENNIIFLRAKSDYNPSQTWKQFGPPATVTRWCCSVHKTAPQVLTLREYTGLHNFTGMAFIGVRASESISRSEYDYVSLGEKHKGQYSCNPIFRVEFCHVTYIFPET